MNGTPSPLYGDAQVSGDWLYRYLLTRWWGPRGRLTPTAMIRHTLRLLPVVMLNPSTADATDDDPTIRRLYRVASGAGYEGIVVANLYALRSPHPASLRLHPDPVGPLNDLCLERLAVEAARYDDPILVAWGASITTPLDGSARARRFLRVIREAGTYPLCLGTTKDGFPRHPLYLPNDTPLEEYRWTS